MQAMCLLTVDPFLIVKALNAVAFYIIIKKRSAYVKRMKSFGGNKRPLISPMYKDATLDFISEHTEDIELTGTTWQVYSVKWFNSSHHEVSDEEFNWTKMLLTIRYEERRVRRFGASTYPNEQQPKRYFIKMSLSLPSQTLIPTYEWEVDRQRKALDPGEKTECIKRMLSAALLQAQQQNPGVDYLYLKQPGRIKTVQRQKYVKVI